MPFTSFDLDPRVLQGIRDLGFVETRPVQSAVIPLVLKGHDIIGCAETGTGKTAAFVLPILHRLIAAGFHETSGIRALILAPTRELAVQIEDEIQGLSYHAHVPSVAVYGGVGMDAQDRALRAGSPIVVATPGRLMDHMRRGAVMFEQLDVLVLDEADRMMDMGFWPDVQRIVSSLPVDRQTLLFSATMPDAIIKLSNGILRNPQYVQISAHRGPASTITHSVHRVETTDKTRWLGDFLKRAEGPSLIFVRTKRGADRLARRLAEFGIRTTALHADRSQSQRTSAVEGFRTGRFAVLVATDIAARGLDIDGIAHVINFEVPDSPETYVHRVGRTGRATASGHAMTLVAQSELDALRALERSVGVQLQ